MHEGEFSGAAGEEVWKGEDWVATFFPEFAQCLRGKGRDENEKLRRIFVLSKENPSPATLSQKNKKQPLSKTFPSRESFSDFSGRGYAGRGDRGKLSSFPRGRGGERRTRHLFRYVELNSTWFPDFLACCFNLNFRFPGKFEVHRIMVGRGNRRKMVNPEKWKGIFQWTMPWLRIGRVRGWNVTVSSITRQSQRCLIGKAFHSSFYLITTNKKPHQNFLIRLPAQKSISASAIHVIYPMWRQNWNCFGDKYVMCICGCACLSLWGGLFVSRIPSSPKITLLHLCHLHVTTPIPLPSPTAAETSQHTVIFLHP